ADHDEIVSLRDPDNVRWLQRAVEHQLPAAALELFGQSRQQQAVVDAAGRMTEVTTEVQRVLAPEIVPVAHVAVLGGIPEVNSQLAFALEGRIVMRYGVLDTTVGDVLRALDAVDRGGHTVLTQEVPQVKTCDTAADDADVRHLMTLKSAL